MADKTNAIMNVQQAFEQLASDPTSTIAIWAASLGGFVVTAAGKAVVGNLALNATAKLFERFKETRSKPDSKIPDDFEQTDHGAKLFQEAIAALMQGLDEDRAKAVQDVFLSLAQTKPADAYERIEQMDILAEASQLEPMELLLINQLQRYSAEVMNVAFADQYEKEEAAAGENRQPKDFDIVGFTNNTKPFHKFLSDQFSRHRCERVLRAADSLHAKKMLEMNNGDIIHTHQSMYAAIRRRGYFTDWGWKVVQHLYAAEPQAD